MGNVGNTVHRAAGVQAGRRLGRGQWPRRDMGIARELPGAPAPAPPGITIQKREKKGILASDPKKKGSKGTVLHLRQDSSPCGTQLRWGWLHFSLSYVKSFGKKGTI